VVAVEWSLESKILRFFGSKIMGYIEYNGNMKVNSSHLSLIAHDSPLNDERA
jgi:hypothetical protein